MPNCLDDFLFLCLHCLFHFFLSTRVSNELGAGRPRVARLAICIALSMVVTEGFLAAAVMILGRRVWGYCYSREEKVVKYVGEMLLLISVSHFFDGIQSVLSGYYFPIIVYRARTINQANVAYRISSLPPSKFSMCVFPICCPVSRYRDQVHRF